MALGLLQWEETVQRGKLNGRMCWCPEQVQNISRGYLRVETANVSPGALIKA